MDDRLSTPDRELVKAREMQQKAHDFEWDNPTCSEAQRLREFWDGQVTLYSAMDGDEIVVMF